MKDKREYEIQVLGVFTSWKSIEVLNLIGISKKVNSDKKVIKFLKLLILLILSIISSSSSNSYAILL